VEERKIGAKDGEEMEGRRTTKLGCEWKKSTNK
jgi:hypothetical protein